MLWVTAENCISWGLTAIESPHLPHNKPVFTFFNKTSSSSSQDFIHLFPKSLFKFLNNLFSIYSVTSLYFSTNLSFLFRKPILPILPTLYHKPFINYNSFRGSLNFPTTLAVSLFIFYRWAFCLSCPIIHWSNFFQTLRINNNLIYLYHIYGSLFVNNALD